VADAILIARSGLADALYRLDKAAVNVVNATAPVQGRPRDGAPVTGATGAPSGGSGDVATAFLDLMSAEMSFKANVEVMRTQADMVRAFYDAID
jgi:flagellar basal body rod protein FlgC